MKSYFPTGSGTKLVVFCSLLLAMGTVTSRAQASVWDKKTVLTVDQPIQVQDTYLEPGTYVFKLADSSSDRHIVQIFDRDQDHLINTILAIPNYRLQPTDNSRFAFWETPPGTAKAMRAWFYPGDNFGQEFRYPKQLHQLAALTSAPAFPPEPPPPPIVTQPVEPESLAAPPPPPPAQVEKQEPVVIAQNTPPPPPAEAAPAPTAPPQELPKTATPYPLIGLSGLLSFGLYGLVRLRRTA